MKRSMYVLKKYVFVCRKVFFLLSNPLKQNKIRR